MTISKQKTKKRVASLDQNIGFIYFMTERDLFGYPCGPYVKIGLVKGNDDVLPNFFIFSSKEVSDSIKQRHIDYLAKPKRDGTPRKGGSLRHFEPNEEFKAERKNNWEIMFK